MKSTTEMLTDIPTLAAEAWLTRTAPNPSGRAPRASRGDTSQPPISVDMIDALMPYSEARPHGLLYRLAECTRICWEKLAPNCPPTTEPPTWASECDWLLATRDDWQTQLDEVDHDWVRGEIYAIWCDLRRVTRAPRPLIVHCTAIRYAQHCGNIVTPYGEELDTGGRAKPLLDWTGARWGACQACGTTYTFDAVLQRLAALQEYTLSEAAELLGVELRTLHRRVHSLGIKPSGRRGNASVWDIDTLRRAARLKTTA